MEVIISRLSFYQGAFLLVVCTVRGFCFLWKSRVQATMNATEDSVIEVLIHRDQGNPEWILFCTYGPPYASLKKYFCGKIWIILGDLNVVTK